MTRENWQGAVEADLAVVFDVRNCGLKCFEQTARDERLCSLGGIDCFGLFKIQIGFDGFVTNAGVQVKRMYPCLKIWEGPETETDKKSTAGDESCHCISHWTEWRRPG
jgi:hypothetical protein